MRLRIAKSHSVTDCAQAAATVRWRAEDHRSSMLACSCQIQYTDGVEVEHIDPVAG